MKNERSVLLVTLLSTLLIFGFIRDEDPLKDLIRKFSKIRDEYPQEKVHIQLDKPYYAVGDTIWFKAYVVNAERNQLSGLSKILYVELINDKDSIKRSLRLPLSAGLGWGDFTISDSLREGNYRIRAYTSWMRNFGEEYFYDKSLTVGNSLPNVMSQINYAYSKVGNSEKVDASLSFSDLSGKPLAQKEVSYDVQLNFRNITRGKGSTDKNGRLKISFLNTQPFILKSGRIATSLKLDEKTAIQKTFPIKATSNAVDLQFFPEGGQMVNNLPAVVAFKAVRADGLGAPVAGAIVDEKNTTITSFMAEHAGMGTFVLTPEPEHRYQAVVKFEDGSEKRVPLPLAASKGYMLSVTNNTADSFRVKIAASKNLIDGSEITLIGQLNGTIHYVSKSKMQSQVVTATLAKSRFPSGILQLTLFSPSYQPVAERLVFINNPKQRLSINVSTDKPQYGPREKVKMTIDVRDSKGKPVHGSFSVAVTDFDKVPVAEEDESTIFSNLLLTSDLKGFVEQPNYYFTGPDAAKIKQLDNLMLTQGWRRFLWKNILSENYPQIAYPPEQSIEISGRVLERNGKPAINAKVTLLSTSGDPFTLDTVTDSQGKFRFVNLAFSSGTNFVVKAQNSRGKKNIDIELNDFPRQMVIPSKNAPEKVVNVNNSILSYIRSNKKKFDELDKSKIRRGSIMLSEVKVVEKKPLVKNSSNLNGAGNADQVIPGDQLQNCVTLVQCLQGRLIGVIFYHNLAYSTRGGGLMGIMVDGVFSPPDYINMIPPRDVESIEVLRNAGHLAIYGLQAGNGIIMINTRHGERDMSAGRYSRGILSYAPQGYYTARQFYSPQYGVSQPARKTMDLRSTIFWKPNIVTDAAGKAQLEFFTADEHGRYRTVIEGLDTEGDLGRQVLNYPVE